MTNPLVYICEDDPSLGQEIFNRLQQEGYQCCLFKDAFAMDEYSNTAMPDLLLLDIQLPGESGYSIAQRYLRAMPNLRVIMMSVLNKQHDVLAGYNCGAMLYLAKPFKPEALLACLRGVFGNISDEANHASKEVCLNVASQTLSYQNISVRLAVSEVKMLMSLSLRYPDVLEYHELMEHLGLDLDSARKNTLETFVSRLRHKLVPIDRNYLTIKTIRNVGYQLSSGITIHT